MDTATITACLVGGAVGDSMGLPYEALSARRARRWSRGPLAQRFVFGHGMVSDDTDHTVFVAQALLRSDGNVDKFRRVLAWRLRLWLLCLPAGIGFGTLRGILKLWLGLRASGVRSAGNGPAMRSALVGACLPTDDERRRAFVTASAMLTHTDPRAIAGALAVAEVAAKIASGQWRDRPDAATFARVVAHVHDDAQWRALEPVLAAACASEAPADALRATLKVERGVSGFVMHSVPFALVAWYDAFGDYERTLRLCIDAGGDVDTNAAMAGALAAMVVGVDRVPRAWSEAIVDWPHSVAYLRALGAALGNERDDVPTAFSAMLLPRGLVFLVIVLAHGLRRLLPPY